MKGLRRRLPVPSALISFEAAARCGGFSLAARELGVTQAAVSKQIRQLEARLKVDLFTRGSRKVVLTPTGRRFHEAVALGLEYIATSAEEIQRREPGANLTIGSTVAVAAFWLRPKIAEFLTINPGTDIRLVAEDRGDVDLSDDLDLAICYGRGAWPGLSAEYLFEEEIFPVYSEKYAPASALSSPVDFYSEKLLHFDRQAPDWVDWQYWFRFHGLEVNIRDHGLRFNNYTIMVQAAIDGQGIALGWGRLVAPLISSRILVPISGMAVRTDRGYHLVWKQDRPLNSNATRLKDWLLARARQETS